MEECENEKEVAMIDRTIEKTDSDMREVVPIDSSSDSDVEILQETIFL